MIWRRLFSQPAATLPAGVHTLLILDASDGEACLPLAQALQSKFGDLGLASVGGPVSLPYPSFEISAASKAHLEKLELKRVIALGDSSAELLPDGTAAVTYIVNATRSQPRACKRVFAGDPAHARGLPDAVVSGDPLAGVQSLPSFATDNSTCVRFKEQRDGGRWIGYFAGTGEDEEDRAYLIFNRLIRHKMGLMVLAPYDPARCEPVYRDAIKYRLQTIRHNRLSTSFVPIKTRVYYVEEAAPRDALYACCDWVVVGGTLAEGSGVIPDIATPIMLRRPIVIGPAGLRTLLLQAALRAGVVIAAASDEELFSQLKHIIDAPEAAAERAERAYAWLAAQPGALERVVAGID